MKKLLCALSLLCVAPVALHAQAGADTQAPATAQSASLVRDYLMPEAVVPLLASGPKLEESKGSNAIESVAVRRGEGTGFMIAGLALFIAGVIVDDDDASTVLILAGAGLGAYGLYLRFR